MSAITTRSGKGSALTNAEVDANFTNLNSDKAEKSITISAGTGLTGGGDLSGNRTFALGTSGVSAGTFGGNNSIPTLTIDAYGRVTAAGTVTPSGTWGISISGNAATATTATNLSGGTISATTGTFSGLLKSDFGTVQVGSSTGIYRQFRYDGTMSADGATFSAILNAANYNSYAPTLTGGGASGTWGINITGNAATATALTSGNKTLDGNLTVQGDIRTYRTGGTTGVVYLSSTDSYYLYWNGTTYEMPGAQLNVAGQRVLNAGNYNSYALPLTGGTLTGGLTATSLSASSGGGQKIYSYISGTVRQGLGVDLNGGSYNSSWFGSAGPSNEGTLSLGFVSQADGTTFSQIARVNASGGFDLLSGRLRVNQGTAGFTGLEAFDSAGGRAQLILSSYYSDLVIASSQSNSSHGSTLSFVSTNPGNAADYRKFVINQGNWGGSQYLSFGWANAAYTNPHNYAGTSQASNTMMLDGDQKIAYVYGSVRSPIFYDSNDTARFVDGSNGGFNMIGGSGNRVTFYTNDSGYQVANAEGSGTTVRLGAAWGRPGSYNNTTYTLGAESSIHFWLAGGEKGYIDTGSNLFMNGSSRAPIFYDQNDTGYYADPNSTSRFNYMVPNRIKCVNNVNNEPRWDFSAYVVEAQHLYGNNSSQTMYLGESNYINIRNIAAVAGDVRSPTYYNLNNTGYYYNFNDSHRFGTPSGYIDIGPKNTGTCHIYTDRSGFYFNQYLYENGRRVLTDDIWINSKYFASSGAIYGTILYDANDSAYYCDPSNASRFYSLTVGIGNSYSDIYMRDDESNSGQTRIHCNSGVIGFLRGDGAMWFMNVDQYGNGYFAGNVASNSDERLKKDWSSLPSDFVERLSLVKHGTYTRTDTEQRQVGASAQGMQNILPEAVGSDLSGMLTLNYGNAALVSAIELAKRIIELERRLAALES